MEVPTTPQRWRWDPSWKERWEDLRRPLGILLSLVYIVLLFFAFSWSRCFFDGCPNVESLAVYQPGGAPVLLDRHGEAFADLAPAERDVVPLSSLPSHVAQAFLAVEDRRFYEHAGIDWHRVGGAVLANFRAGQFAQGFSTITMQLARNVFPERIPGQEQTTRRKLIEIRVAQEIERKYSKEEILELYLNNIYFGNRARGIEAAARQYFGHSARELTLPEAALLAAIPKAPSHYDPRRHPDAALERRNLVIALMKEQGRIPRFIAEDARRSALRVVPAPRQEQVESGLAPYFVEQVRRELEERFGPELYTQPLRIVTTLDSAAQRATEEELRAQLKRVENGRLGGFNGPGYSLLAETPAGGTPYLQGAAVMLEARTGDVLAWVGGRDYAQSQFDRVIQARRQPGSAFKPFVYAAALTNGWVLSQPLLDQPLRVRLPGGQLWQPHNFTDQYEGRVTVRDALVRSKNVPTVRLADAVGIGQVTDLARQAGIDEDMVPVPSIALGSAAVSPLELTAAYTAFATLGEAAEPRLILRLENENGKVLWRSEPRRHKVLDPSVAYLVTDVLAEALVRGTGNLVQETGLDVPAAGKTGTTNDGADAWFVGYTPEIVAGIWVGFDQPRPILEDATGGRLAAPVWGRTLARVYQKRPHPKPWSAPEHVVTLPVDPGTGLVIEAGCKAGNSTRELFIEGMVPASYCPGREAPPSNGFPAQRLMAERKEEHREDRALEERREEIARAEAEADRREKEIAAREKKEKTEQARLAEQKAEQKAERDRLEKRREKIARAEAAADRREKEIAAREDEEEKEARADRDEDDRKEEASSAADDLSGWWEMTNTIQSTNYADYKGLRLGYRIQLDQDGDRIVGRGQKWSENGRTLPASARTPLTVTGTIDGNKVILEFRERGAKRTTTGSFSWTLSADRTALRGSFQSTAADTSGRSLAVRMP